MAKKAVAKTAHAPLETDVPDWYDQYKDVDETEFDRDDLLIPRLKLAQSGSPEVKDKLCNEGDLIHSITKEVIGKAGDPIRVIFVAYNKEYVLWRERETGGGILARATKVKDSENNPRYAWDKPNTTFEDKIKGLQEVTYTTQTYVDQDGLHEWGSKIPGDKDSKPAAVGTYNYVVMLPDHDNEMIALSLSRSAASKARQWNSLLQRGEVPKFLRIYTLDTFMDSNDEYQYANYKFNHKFEKVLDPEFGRKLAEMSLALKQRGVQVDLADDDEHSNPAQKSSDQY